MNRRLGSALRASDRTAAGRTGRPFRPWRLCGSRARAARAVALPASRSDERQRTAIRNLDPCRRRRSVRLGCRVRRRLRAGRRAPSPCRSLPGRPRRGYRRVAYHARPVVVGVRLGDPALRRAPDRPASRADGRGRVRARDGLGAGGLALGLRPRRRRAPCHVPVAAGRARARRAAVLRLIPARARGLRASPRGRRAGRVLRLEKDRRRASAMAPAVRSAP